MLGVTRLISGDDVGPREGSAANANDRCRRGTVIVVTMSPGPDGGVERVDIRGKVEGIQLEASADTAATPAPDSTRRGKRGG